MSDIQLKSVVLSNHETVGYREREGGEEVILLVHGNMTSSKHWDVVMENLDSRFKVYAIDLRGFGISTYHNLIRDLSDFTRDTKLFTDALGLTSFHLVGWSTGGGVCMQFAADYPDQVKKLILMASVSTRGYPYYHFGADGLPDITRRVITREQMLALPLTQTMSSAGARRDREFMRAAFNAGVYNINKPSDERYEAYLDDILTQRNLADVYHGLNTFNISDVDNEAAAGTGAVKRIAAPTLVIQGSEDLIITEQMRQEILEDLGVIATSAVLEGCGHSPMVDDLPGLLKHMEDFMTAQSEQPNEIAG
jgi:pimeloyl-ACP methyl ester carboxylesterase